jgi:Asp-tRNA(Asn)/Glu-tRNA(Gln) amidotransferase A subunit family amidase
VELRDTLVGFADWLGHGHGERAEAWLARLEVNRPELELFRAAATPSSPAYIPCATIVAPADGVALAGERMPADAPASLERARARSDLNAFTWLPDELPAAGGGLLAGVPVAVKDLMHVEGAPFSGGSKAIGRVVADRDAEVVARLKRAGAVVMGLTNLHEFAYGITSDNPHFGRVVNPAAPDRIPGGSSGGSAAAIAAGIVRIAVGTDTAGSIRIPAACCGIAGFKPSYDALPRDGVLDLAPTLDHVGPMGRTIEDCAVMFAAMLELPAVPAWRYRDLTGRTVARLGGYFEAPLDEEVRRSLDAAARALVRDGARCVERSIEGVESASAIQLITICGEATAIHAERARTRGDDMGEDVRVRVEMGHFIPGHWYVKAQRLRRALAERIEGAFAAADVLLCATLRTPAPAIGASRVDIGGKSYALHTAVTNLTLPFNLAGLPAASIPWTWSTDGIPICIQVIGPRGHDWRTLAVAQRLESLAPWRRRVSVKRF